MIFRIISNWYNTREDMLRLLNGTMSGPSTTAGTDLNLNRHLWLQGGVKVVQTIRNPCSYPQHVTIYKHNLKCPDSGQTRGIYVEGTLPFAVGSAMDVSNQPWNEYWDFFDQSSRQAMGSAGDTAYMKFTGDEQMTFNSTGGYGSSLFTPGNKWEVGSGNTSSMDFRETAKLSWLFPEMRKKLKTRVVFSGWVPAMGSRSFTYSATMPSELRPRDYITNDCMNFSKHSYFLSMRAYAPKVLDSAFSATGQDSAVPGLNNLPYGFWRPPAMVSLVEARTYRFRRAGDSIPSFGSADGFANATTAAAGGWLGPNWGLQAFVPYKSAPTILNGNATTAIGARIGIVPTYRSAQVPFYGNGPGYSLQQYINSVGAAK